eukprot:scaffold322408_cov156-Cyclotella_meneghiniana.AAC.1
MSPHMYGSRLSDVAAAAPAAPPLYATGRCCESATASSRQPQLRHCNGNSDVSGMFGRRLSSIRHRRYKSNNQI